MIMTFGFPAHSSHEKCLSLEVSDYHLIFDLNGVLLVKGEDQTRTHLVVVGLGLKEFLTACVKKITVYIWSSATKRNFLRHLEIIAEKIGVRLSCFRIVDQLFYFRNEYFLPKKPDKPIFHKNLLNFFYSISWYDV
jgi:hypothetical protein